MSVFIDGQNLRHRCVEHFGWPWVHPRRLAEFLVQQDKDRYGVDSHVLRSVHYYTGIHDPNVRPTEHGELARRLASYAREGVMVTAIPLRYDQTGRAREKGVDTRLALDAVRWGRKGLYDVVILVSADSDLDEVVREIFELRDAERWIAVENALPKTTGSHTHWLPSARRKRVLDLVALSRIEDRATY